MGLAGVGGRRGRARAPLWGIKGRNWEVQQQMLWALPDLLFSSFNQPPRGSALPVKGWWMVGLYPVVWDRAEKP